MSTFVPTKFVWRFGGSQVHLCGSFTRWVETVPMVPVEGQAGTYSVVVHLPPGYHQYKFIVDGEWRHDETQPFMPDPLGNVNNWLFVRKPELSQHTGALQAQLQGQQAQQSMVQSGRSSGPSTGSHLTPEEKQPGTSGDQDMDVSQGEDVTDGVLAPIAAQVDEPQYTRRKIKEFLAHHTAYELIPESGKVVLLDIDLPLRQAFHALHEQGLASAPLYDAESDTVAGIVSASDFIATLQRLRSMVTSNNSNPMSEIEMDQHTIRGLREELISEGRPPKRLVHVSPADSLAQVVQTLFENHCSMAPVIYPGPQANTLDARPKEWGPEVHHMATLAGVLACLMRHFRASLASLPLLAQPLQALPVGTWAPDSSVATSSAKMTGFGGDNASERRDVRRIAPLHVVRPSTPLTEALGLLLEAGISCLPVVDKAGALVDVYARADITMLAKGNAYSRLQFEDVTVGQALALATEPAPPPQMGAPALHQWGNPSPSGSSASIHDAGLAPQRQRMHICTAQDALRSVIERLAMPGVRRVVVVHPETRRVEGIVSLSDVAAFMLL